MISGDTNMLHVHTQHLHVRFEQFPRILGVSVTRGSRPFSTQWANNRLRARCSRESCVRKGLFDYTRINGKNASEMRTETRVRDKCREGNRREMKAAASRSPILDRRNTRGLTSIAENRYYFGQGRGCGYRARVFLVLRQWPFFTSCDVVVHGQQNGNPPSHPLPHARPLRHRFWISIQVNCGCDAVR
jgi:hypothetical protein